MTKRIMAMLLVCALSISAAAGCSKRKGTEDGTGRQGETVSSMGEEENGVKKLTETKGQADGKRLPESDELDDTLKKGINTFAYDLFEKLEEGENMFFSPYSISLALSMLDNGAKNKTKEEMEMMLGIEDLSLWNQQVRAYLKQEKDEKAALHTANSIWFSENMYLKDTADEELFEPGAFYYQADIYQADFTDSETLKKMNQWVADQTENMINPFLEELDPDTVMCLFNAVYFNGEWKHKFMAENTYQESFYGKKGEKKVSMMNQGEEFFRYLEVGDIRAIELPYGEEKVAMDILIPSENTGKDIRELFAVLSNEEKENLFTRLGEEEKKMVTLLRLPKFELEYGFKELNTVLIEMGMRQAFTYEADFDGINPDLNVSMVGHKAKLEVDEEGSRAAAATVISMEETAKEVEERLEFIVDQPFIFVIRDCETGVILFMGGVNEL